MVVSREMVGESEARGSVGSSLDARCAVHPERAAVATCARCGNYSCELCVAGGRGLCSACRERQGPPAFPFHRGNYSLTGLFDYCFERWKQHWLALMLVMGGFLVVIYGFSFGGVFALSRPPTAASASPAVRFVPVAIYELLQITLQVGLQLPLLTVFLAVLERRPIDSEAALRSLRRLPSALLQALLFFLLFVPFMLVAAIPIALFVGFKPGATPPGWLIGVEVIAGFVVLVYVGLGGMFALPELVCDPRASAWGALRNSFRIVANHRLRAFGIMIAAGIVTLAGALACGIGLLATGPFATLVFCALFLALRTEAPPA